MLKPTYPFYLANEAHTPNTDLKVTDKYTGEVATRVALADAKVIDQAIAAAVAAQEAMAAMPPYERQNVLNHCARASPSASRNWRWRCASRPASRSATPAARSSAWSTPSASPPARPPGSAARSSNCRSPSAAVATAA
jgi:hypothetical protein